MSKGVLTFFCGKMGAGKSTKAREIAQQSQSVLLSEDEWLATIYPNKIASLSDYIEYSSLLRPMIKTLVQSILSCGTDVVMDFPANTVTQRAWFKRLLLEVDAPHCLIFLDVDDELCLQRIKKRASEHPERSKTDTPEMFAQVTNYFVAPTDDEGFNINVIAVNEE